MNANTKENIKEVKEAIKKVAEKKSYKVGDQIKAYGKDCKIVEVLEGGRFHLKNLQEPYDSFVILENEIDADSKELEKVLTEVIEDFGVERLAKAIVAPDDNAPDLMVREDNRFSL